MSNIYNGSATAVYVFLRSTDVTTQQANTAMGAIFKARPSMRSTIWSWRSEWLKQENPAHSLDVFFNSDYYLQFKVGVKKLRILGKLNAEIHLVIGFGDSVTASTYPILTFSQESLTYLADTTFEFQVHIDEDISLTQVGLE